MKKILPEKNCVTDLRARKHTISRDRSDFLIENFKKNRSGILNPKLARKDNEVGIIPFCETFNAKAVRHILDRADCEGLRVHMGLNEEFQLVFVLRGVDENGKDILEEKVMPVQQPAVQTMAMSFMAPVSKESSYSLDDAQRVPPWPPTEK
ncbi:MAG: hypothetical protein INR69_08955 [Mucilaginibacter polytrichastri]|nr:hypothetical protein [Mucilaginibacter polytrichastri]